MQNELTIKWRVITDGVKRGLFGERQRAREKAKWYWMHGGYAKEDVKVARHVVKPGKCKPAAITGGL